MNDRGTIVAKEIVACGSKCSGSVMTVSRRVPPRLGVCARTGLAASCGPVTASARAPAPVLRTSRRDRSWSVDVLLMASSSTVCASARGQLTPEAVGAGGGDATPQLDGPAALAAELGAPGPQPPGRKVQRVLVGEADGAVRLVRDAGPDAGRLARPDLGGGDLEVRLAAVGGAERLLGGDARGRHVAGQDGEVVLDRLEVADGPAELLALGGVADRLLEQRLQRA